MRAIRFLLLLVAMSPWLLPAWSPAGAAVLQLEGSMTSRVDYRVRYRVVDAHKLNTLRVSFVEPPSFTSPTTRQTLEDFSVTFTPPPDARTKQTDARGNLIHTARWREPGGDITAKLSIRATVEALLPEIRTTAPFPLAESVLQDHPEAAYYLQSTGQVQSDHPEIIARAEQLTVGAKSLYDAVQRCISFVVDHMRYTSPPEATDALAGMRLGAGDCRTISHLAAALLRALDIPVRVVNGYTADKPYDVPTRAMTYTFRMADGRHSWIEVWFPDLGFVPFDAQNSVLFVPNRYLRCEVGLDNTLVKQDGLMVWSRSTSIDGPKPRIVEEHDTDFGTDTVELKGEMQTWGPVNLMRAPRASALFTRVAALRPDASPDGVQPPLAPPPPPADVAVLDGPPAAAPLAIPEDTAPSAPPADAPSADPSPPRQTVVIGPLEIVPAPDEGPAPPQPTPAERIALGNTNFPENVDFTTARDTAQIEGGEYVSRPSYLVETAEYVTTGRRQFAQIFTVERPMLLEKVELGLHAFGGGGQLWVEIFRSGEDPDGGGGAAPERLLASSSIRDLDEFSTRPGYRWAPFDFSAAKPLLQPGDYWIGLGFSGRPVVNWFYTYGKPVGPVDGTRYKDLFASAWSGAMGYEFIYRVSGPAMAGLAP